MKIDSLQKAQIAVISGLQTEEKVVSFANYLTERIIEECEVTDELNDGKKPYIIHRSKVNLLNIDYDFFIMCLGDFLGNKEIAFYLKSDDDSSSENVKKRSLVLIFLFLNYGFLYSNVQNKNTIYFNAYYMPSILSRSGEYYEMKTVSISMGFLTKHIEQKDIERMIDYADNKSIEMEKYGSKQCPAFWARKGLVKRELFAINEAI